MAQAPQQHVAEGMVQAEVGVRHEVQGDRHLQGRKPQAQLHELVGN